MTPTKRQGRPPTMAARTDLHISVSAELRERLRAESLRTGESEAEIGRQALEAELSRRTIDADFDWTDWNSPKA